MWPGVRCTRTQGNWPGAGRAIVAQLRRPPANRLDRRELLLKSRHGSVAVRVAAGRPSGHRKTQCIRATVTRTSFGPFNPERSTARARERDIGRAMRTLQGPGPRSVRLAAHASGAGCAPTRPRPFAPSAQHGLRADDSGGRGAGAGFGDEAGARNRAMHAFPARVYGGRLRKSGSRSRKKALRPADQSPPAVVRSTLPVWPAAEARHRGIREAASLVPILPARQPEQEPGRRRLGRARRRLRIMTRSDAETASDAKVR